MASKISKGRRSRTLLFGPIVERFTRKGFERKGGSSKSETRADDLARQQLAQAQAEQKATEAKFLRTPDDVRLLKFLEERMKGTGEDLVRETGPVSSRLVDLIGERLKAPPQIPFESTLQPSLQLAQQQVAALANQRGLVGSGLELEQFGRAGVDLAIKEAQARQQNALQNQALIQETLDRASGLAQFGSGLQAEAAGTATEFEEFLRKLEAQGVGVGEQAFQQGAGRQFQFQSAGLDALNQREQQARQRNAAIAQALGSAALGGVTGGLGFLPGIAGMAGGLGGAARGFGQGFFGSLTGTGAFGLQGQLDALRRAGLFGAQQGGGGVLPGGGLTQQALLDNARRGQASLSGGGSISNLPLM